MVTEGTGPPSQLARSHLLSCYRSCQGQVGMPFPLQGVLVCRSHGKGQQAMLHPRPEYLPQTDGWHWGWDPWEGGEAGKFVLWKSGSGPATHRQLSLLGLVLVLYLTGHLSYPESHLVLSHLAQ